MSHTSASLEGLHRVRIDVMVMQGWVIRMCFCVTRNDSSLLNHEKRRYANRHLGRAEVMRVSSCSSPSKDRRCCCERPVLPLFASLDAALLTASCCGGRSLDDAASDDEDDDGCDSNGGCGGSDCD